MVDRVHLGARGDVHAGAVRPPAEDGGDGEVGRGQPQLGQPAEEPDLGRVEPDLHKVHVQAGVVREGEVVGRREQMQELVGFLRTAGPTLSPFNAWVFLKGLETLRLRMRAHCESAQQIAEWLEQCPEVERVYYAGLPSHPQHALAKAQQSAFGAVVSFELRGGREAAWRFIDATRMVSITANLGDAKTTITHPATTTHGRLSAEAREAAGIREGLIRLAIGLEDLADIKADLQRGFDAQS